MKHEEKAPKDKLKNDDNNKDLPYNPDITPEDKQALNEEGLSMNSDRDRFLAERERPVDFAAEDLDIPGRDESDTTHDGTDIPDEENQQYNMRGTRSDEEKARERENDLIDDDDDKDRS